MAKGNYYIVLGVPLESSDQEIQDRYKELSLQNHSDKGGDGEQFKKIVNAYEVLGNPHQRLKYDLSLSKTSEKGDYIESEKWGTTYQLDEMFGNDLVLEIISLLSQELKDSDLTNEELSIYGRKVIL